MRHYTSDKFWNLYLKLPLTVRELADKNFEILKTNPNHPSLHFKEVGEYVSVRVGLKYRAIGIKVSKGVVWFWIGTHSEYDILIK